MELTEPLPMADLRSQLKGVLSGAVVASMVLTALLTGWQKAGEPSPPSLKNTRFSVAVLQGPKQSTQEAPADVDKTAPEVVIAAPEVSTNSVAAAERETSLPEAVAAAQESAVGPEAPKQEEVIPPAQVSMPGGRLVAQDAPVGDQPDPFAVGPNQVYLRLLVDEKGKPVRGGIVRQGSEPMRDVLILKAMMSRTYRPEKLIRSPGEEKMWQVDLVIDYGTDEFIP